MKQTRDIVKRIEQTLFACKIRPIKQVFGCPHCHKKTLVSLREGKLRCLDCGTLYSITQIDQMDLAPAEKIYSLLYAAMDLLESKDKANLKEIEGLLCKAEKLCKNLDIKKAALEKEEHFYLLGWIYSLLAEIFQRKNDLEQALFFARKSLAKRIEAKEMDGDEMSLYLLAQSCRQAAWIAARLEKKGEKAWIEKGLQILRELEKENPDYLEFTLSQTADFYEMKLAYFDRKGDEKGREKTFRDYLEWMRRMEKEYTQNVSLFTLRFIRPVLKEAQRLKEKGFLNGSLYFYFKALEYQFNLFLQKPDFKSLKPLLDTYQAMAKLLIALDEPALAARLLHTLMALFEEEFRHLLSRARPKAKVVELLEKTDETWNALLEKKPETIKEEHVQAKIAVKAQKKRSELLHLYNLAHLHLHLSFLETCRGDRINRELLLCAAREIIIQLQIAEFYAFLNPAVLEIRGRIEGELARAFSLSKEYEEAARLYDQAACTYKQLFELEPYWAHSRSQMQMLFYLADISQRSGNEEEYRIKSEQALDLFDKYQQDLKQ